MHTLATRTFNSDTWTSLLLHAVMPPFVSFSILLCVWAAVACHAWVVSPIGRYFRSHGHLLLSTVAQLNGKPFTACQELNSACRAWHKILLTEWTGSSLLARLLPDQLTGHNTWACRDVPRARCRPCIWLCCYMSVATPTAGLSLGSALSQSG